MAGPYYHRHDEQMSHKDRTARRNRTRRMTRVLHPEDAYRFQLAREWVTDKDGNVVRIERKQ